MNKFIEEYNKRKEVLLKNKALYEERVKEAIKKYENIKNSDIDRKETRLSLAANNVSRRIYALNIIEEQLAFLRPANEEDISYRLRQYGEFSRIIRDIVPEDLPLRFHGCPIYTAKQIINTGEISSSVDRIGFETSYDTEGQISVTTKDTIETTVQGYAELIGNYCLPSGCIFVLLPKDEQDRESGKSMLMGNVNFKEEPARLFGIITTPENIEMVSNWCEVNNIDASKVHDYDSFTLLFNRKNNIKK